MKSQNLLSIDSNAKTVKGQKLGYKTAILYLAPSRLVWKAYRSNPRKFRRDLKMRYGIDMRDRVMREYLERVNLCPFAKTCLKGCLNTAGRGAFNSIQWARALKTAFFVVRRIDFEKALIHELRLFKKRDGEKFNLAFRMNGTSDLDEGGPIIAARNLGFQVYDYTKDFGKALNTRLENYHLTYSIQRPSDLDIWASDERAQFNAAIVTREGIDDPVLERFQGMKLIDGDGHDLRFLDPQGKNLVVLKAKGKAKKDKGQFLVNNWNR